ncbi:MAG: cytochrome c biogenesis protein CcsA [Rhodothermales bacterium]
MNDTMTITPVNVRRYTLVRNIVAVWLTAVVLGAFLLDIPKLVMLEHTARNLYFHVPMWFAMLAAAGIGGYHAARYLKTGAIIHDLRSREAARLGVIFGLLGLLTGMLWARFTWYESAGIWWNFDPKQTMAAVGLLIYGAYFVLRSSLEDEEKRARLSAVYHLFAAVTLPFLLYVIPRQYDTSLHPGAEGNPAFSEITYWKMRFVLYPAFAGFIALMWVLYTQRVRIALAHLRLHGETDED